MAIPMHFQVCVDEKEKFDKKAMNEISDEYSSKISQTTMVNFFIHRYEISIVVILVSPVKVVFLPTIQLSAT